VTMRNNLKCLNPTINPEDIYKEDQIALKRFR
jgi:hypothetical protein